MWSKSWNLVWSKRSLSASIHPQIYQACRFCAPPYFFQKTHITAYLFYQNINQFLVNKTPVHMEKLWDGWTRIGSSTLPWLARPGRLLLKHPRCQKDRTSMCIVQLGWHRVVVVGLGLVIFKKHMLMQEHQPPFVVEIDWVWKGGKMFVFFDGE